MSTSYVILEATQVDLGDDGPGEVTVWRELRDDDGELTVYDASGQEGALNQLEATLPDDASGTWKAVPLRSWKGGRTLQPQTRRVRLPFAD